jgi:pentatricopeptide repeat protein
MRAEALLKRMQNMSDEGISPFSTPDIVSFTSVIRAWSQSKSVDAAEKAESLLLQCRERSITYKTVTPDTIMYNTVLQAWAEHRESQKENFKSNARGETGARRAESLLRLMKESDRTISDEVSYNIVMNAWFKSGNHRAAAERARELFGEMKQEYLEGDINKKPDAITYNTVIKIIGQSPSKSSFDEARALIDEMQVLGLKPGTLTYNHLMSATVKSGEPDAVEKAEALLQEMEEMYKKGNNDVRPTEVSFNILLHAYAKSKDRRNAVKAEKLLDRMVETLEQDGREGTGASTQSFASVLDAYANCGNSQAAEDLFDRMAASGRVQVNTVTYNTVLNAFAKSGDKNAPYRAEALLDRMQTEYESGNKDARPNVISFSSVLNSWAKSSLEGAAERAE